MRRVIGYIREIECRLRAGIDRLGGFRLYAALLFLAMTAAYNAQIWRMGYYYDDWEGVFLQKQLFSAGQIWQYFLIDRPFSALTHLLFNPLLGANPIGWRILGQVLNWAAVLCLVKALLEVWPRRVMVIGWIGLLLALYPGITRQFVVRTSIPHYTSLLLFTLSLLLMFKAIKLEAPARRKRALLTGLAVGLAILQALIIEYFAGLELIRLLLLFYVARRDSPAFGKAARKALRLWLPYAAAFAIFLIFRLEVLPAIQMQGMVAKNQPKILAQLLASPLKVMLQYAQTILRDSVYAVLYVWSSIIAPDEIDLQARATLFSWLIGAAAAVLCAVGVEVWHQKVSKKPFDAMKVHKEPYPGLVLIICLAALLLGGLPVWIIGRQATVGIWSGRYLFGPVMGAVPLVVLLTVWLTGSERVRAQSIFLAALLAGSLALQFRTANKYALNWDYQRDYYWQLKWRAPALKPGTFILSPYTPFSYNADYEIAYAINILYAPGNGQARTSYWWFDGPDDVLDFDTGQYPAEKQINTVFRSLSFQSDMQHALPVHYRPARGCLQVVDPAYRLEPGLLPEEQALYTVHNEGLVEDGGAPAPTDVFGPEPEHGWCYYFQKADRARELKQWDEANRLWDAAAAKGLKPGYGPEYLPFLEASIRGERWEQALEMTQAANQTPKMAPLLCSVWSGALSDENQVNWKTVNNQLGCTNSK